MTMTRATFLPSCALLLALPLASTFAETFEVEAGGDIQAAIDDASDGDVIELEAGVYTPSATLDTLGKAITILGVVDGAGEPASILDGQDSRRVLQCINEEGNGTIFENLLITGGSAAIGAGMYNFESSPSVVDCFFENGTAKCGGGMYNLKSNPTLNNCQFNANEAYWKIGGGGMCNEESSPTITGCFFSANEADHSGGAMHNDSGSNPTVVDTVFADNTAYFHGGGMANYGGSPTLTNCEFTDNVAGSSAKGGGVYNEDNSPIVLECKFERNSAGLDGGGMYNAAGTSSTLTGSVFSMNAVNGYGGGVYNGPESQSIQVNCTFEFNEAGYGGGIYNGSGSTSDMDGCIIQNNSAGRGGAAYNKECSASFNKCMFIENSAIGSQGDGGAMFNGDAVVIEVIDCTFKCNLADDQAGAMFNIGSSPSIRSCIFENNSAFSVGCILNASESSPLLEGCTLQGNSSSYGGGCMQNGWGCGPVLDGCTFAANACVSGAGGAVYNDFNSSLTVISCSFNDNTSKVDGGAMYIRDDTEGAVTVSLTSFCGNSPQDISGVWEDNGGNVFDDACPQGCPADFNDDGIVDGADLTILLANWGLTCESCGPDCPADLDNSGQVGGADLSILLGEWGSCP